MELPVFSLEGDLTGRMELDFVPREGKVAAVKKVVTAYLANQRRGTASTKARGEVRGGGKKPWRQKGTGRARAGSIRSPLWRGGGITFGPKPRSFYSQPPAGMRTGARRIILADKLNQSKVKVIDNLEKLSGKTKELASIMVRLGIKNGTLLMVKNPSIALRRAGRNLRALKIVGNTLPNVYDLLKYDQLLLSRESIGDLKGMLE